MNDNLQVLLRIEIQVLHDAETTAQGCGDESRTSGRADERELRQLQLNRARRSALADHDVKLVVLHRRIQDLFNLRLEAMNLVNKEHFAFLQICQERRQIAA